MVFNVTHSYTMFNRVVFLIFNDFHVTPLYTMFYNLRFSFFYDFHCNSLIHNVLHSAFHHFPCFSNNSFYTMFYNVRFSFSMFSTVNTEYTMCVLIYKVCFHCNCCIYDVLQCVFLIFYGFQSNSLIQNVIR